jgi:hypothetical protein
MFIGLTEEPRVVDIYRVSGEGGELRVSLRVAEREAPGRLWANLTFKSEVELQGFVNAAVFAASRQLPEKERPELPFPKVAPLFWVPPVTSKK